MRPVLLVRHHPRAAASGAALLLVLALLVPVRQSLVRSFAVPDVTVDSTADDGDLVVGDGLCQTASGACTLRAALQEANGPLVDTINFAVPVSDPNNDGLVVTFTPATPLPTITDAVTIDGTTQSLWVDDPIVAISGATAGGTVLDVDAASTLRGLVVHDAGTVGIDLDGAGSTVTGTWVGVRPDGTTAAGGTGDGILVRTTATGTTLGGPAAADGVVVADAGGHGVHVLADGTRLVAVRVGTSPDGTIPMGVGGDGVRFDGVTGGVVQDGAVANSGGAGVAVVGGSDDVAVIGTTLVANGGLAIDLGVTGVAPNDPGDGDPGDNGLLNHPVVTDTGVASVDVTLDVDVPVGDDVRIEVFRNPSGADPSGFGEAEELVGTTTFTSTGVSAVVTVPTSQLAAGDVLTATATEVVGPAFGATSELGPAATVTLAVVNTTGDAGDASPGDGVCAAAGVNVDGDPACTLRAALQEVAAATVDGIAFAVPDGEPGKSGGVVTIAPATDLPAVAGPVAIDGTTQPGFTGDPVVAIDGAGVTGPVLDVTAADVTVTSLAVLRGPSHGLTVTADDVTIADTWVGLAPDAVTEDGPAGDGVRVDGGAARVRVDGGRIHAAGGNGVTVLDPADDVAVTDTLLVGIAGLPIDLGDDGPTANDAGDVDTGPNGLLNAPEPTFATLDEVDVDLDVAIAGDYRLDLFRNPTGSGQAEELLATAVVTHPATGPTSFTLAGLSGVADGDQLTLVATELLGGVPGSSSEVSAPILADDHHADVNSTGDAGDAVPGDGQCDTGGLNVDLEPECTLRAALQEAAVTPRVTEVRFAVPALDPGNDAGVVTIAPGADLPAVTTALLVDGTTQPGFVVDPVVAIDGRGVTGSVLTVAAADVELRSIAVHGGPSHGLLVTGDDVSVTDTWIGLRPDATIDGVAGDGIRVDGAVRVLVDGGRVRGSGGTGVAVVNAADDVAVVGTTVAGNGGLGIDLADDGVTANDPGDADTGANELLNRPTITGVAEAAGTVTLDVALDLPAPSVLLQVFTTPAPDPAGAGEGPVLVHSETVLGGTATRSVSFAGDLAQPFTVTATEDLGGTFGSTSEFSDTASVPFATDDPGLVPAEVLGAGALSLWRLGEPAGSTTVRDAGPTGADGAVAGGATLGTAGVTVADDDTAVDLDGVDGVVVVPHDPAYLLAEGAVSLWVRLDGLAGTQTVLAKDALGRGDGGHAALRVLADGSVQWEQASTTGSVVLASGAGAVAVGTWHHLAATFGDRGVELWVDGARVDADETWTTGWDASAGGTTGNTEPITLGAGQRTSTPGTADVLDRFVDGRIDEAAVFGTQVDGATIAAIAGAAPQGTYTATSGLPLTVGAAAGVLANDHDADGDAPTATLVAGPAAAAAFSLAPDGSFTYTSTAGFTGTDTFTYTADDATGVSVPATVTVTVLPDRADRAIRDSSGNAHDGRAAGGMTSGDEVAGKVGTALDLDGADDRVVADNLDVAGTELTISAWLDADGLGTDPVVLAKALGVADADTAWRLRLDDTTPLTGDLQGSVRTGSGLVTVTDPGATAVADGWVHVALRADGATLTLFVDGVVVATAPQTGALQPDPRTPVGIGATADGGAPFDGRIDEVRVSATARSDAWIAAMHATMDAPGSAVAVGAVQTSASPGWTASTAQARSGTTSALAPSGVLRSWLTLDGLDEAGLEARAWWRVTTLTGLDVGQGLRAGDAAGTDPVTQDEVGLFDGAGWDLGQVLGTRTQLVAPPAGQTPTVDTWQRVVVRIDQTNGLSATADGIDVPASGAALAGVRPTGTFGLRVEDLPASARWWVDDVVIRRYVTPEPVAVVRRTEQAP